ncbi:MAG: phosphoribosylaminoimidazolesuccinocarboxamide synthase [Bacteriovoracaceae bacterium]
MSLPPLLKEGSVKNIRGILGQTPYVFEFSNRYSVFDWGAMPDELTNKGDCLAYMAWMFFDILGDPKRWQEWEPNQWAREKFGNTFIYNEILKNGVDNHCIGLVDDSNQVLDNGSQLTRNLAVEPVRIFDPTVQKNENGQLEYIYTDYEKCPTDSLIPLEVIFRFGVPAGSSLLKRINDPEYLASLGVDNTPCEGDRFDFPIIEYSTKLENTDRYITKDNAYKIASLSEVEIKRLEGLVSLLSLRLKDIFKDIGVELWDGKFELAFSKEVDANGNRYITLVDSIGPDELRLTYEGVQLSKETIRKRYRGTEWYKAVEEAKVIADQRGEEDWKSICINEIKKTPPHLSEQEVETFSMMYKTLTNEICKKFYDKEIFPQAWSFTDLIKKIQ